MKNCHLQNNLLTAVICWTNSHLNTAAVTVNSITFLGWKSIEIYENYDITSCNSQKRWLFLSQYCTSTFLCEQTFIKEYWWFDWWSMIAFVASFRQDLDSKNRFPSTRPNEWYSLHHSGSHLSAKNPHTNIGLILTLLTIWVRQVLDKKLPKMAPFPSLAFLI